MSHTALTAARTRRPAHLISRCIRKGARRYWQCDVTDSTAAALQEEFARVVQLEVVMWMMAIIWVIAPSGSHVAVWMTAVFLVASVVAGTKLHVVTMRLAAVAYSSYKDELTPAQKLKVKKGGSKPKGSFAPMLNRMSKHLRRTSVLGAAHDQATAAEAMAYRCCSLDAWDAALAALLLPTVWCLSRQ